MALTASPMQENVFRFVRSDRRSAVVIAVAGGGKTTTIITAAKQIPFGLSCCFVAFNKNIANELRERLPKHIRAMTLNGMGYSAWLRHLNKKGDEITLDGGKLRNIASQMLTPDEYKMFGAQLPKLVSLAKSVGLVPHGVKDAMFLTRDTDSEWLALMDHYDVEFEEGADESKGIDLARRVLKADIECADKLIDFDDQLYMPVIMRARFWQNDIMFVDEAQDVNMIQRAMIRRALKPNGRLIAVGDPCQAIYGFRGADCDAIDNIKKEFNAIELPLSMSYRCPKLVVEEAQKYVNHIQAFEGAKEGHVEFLSKWDNKLEAFQSFAADTAILCRNSAPLIKCAYRLLANGTACCVLGREIGQGLVSLINKMKAKTIASLETKLHEYFSREKAKFEAKGEEQKAGALADKVETIFVFIEQLTEDRRTIPALVENIEALFDDSQKGILTLCTVHKSKGLEWERVFILEPALMPSSYARQAWQQKQEVNLQYVAVTRSKGELYYIELKGWAEVKKTTAPSAKKTRRSKKAAQEVA